jgi:transposase
LAAIARTNFLGAIEFEAQYKEHLSGYIEWEQKEHADKWLLFEKNSGEKLSIDELSVTNGELYTVVTNKQAKGGKGSLVAIIAGVKSSEVIATLSRLPQAVRDNVKEVTLDMSNAMDKSIKGAFKKATLVTDRFHVQQIVTEAVQEIRIQLRKQAIKEESKAVLRARKKKKQYQPNTYENEDTKKQLLARSRYLLFKPSSKWTESQQKRAFILFREFPELHHAYNLSMMFRSWYENNKNKEEAREGLQHWYKKIEEEQIEPFLVAAESIKAYEETILNYFNNRSTNASAESFNAKLKGFRTLVRGVRDVKFFLFRVAKLYG